MDINKFSDHLKHCTKGKQTPRLFLTGFRSGNKFLGPFKQGTEVETSFWALLNRAQEWKQVFRLFKTEL